MRRAALGKIMGSRPRLLFRVTSRTSRVAEVVVMVTAVMGMGRRSRTRQRSPQVTAAEDSPVFQAFRLNFPTYLVVLGMEEGKALGKRFHNPARIPPHMRLPSHRTVRERIGLFRNPVQTNPLYTRRPTRHPMPRASLSHLEESTNLLTSYLRDNSDLAVEWERGDTVVLGVVRLGNPNHEPRTTRRTRIMDAVTLEPQGSPTLSEVTDSRQMP